MVWKRESEKCKHGSLWMSTQGLDGALPSCPGGRPACFTHQGP